MKDQKFIELYNNRTPVKKIMETLNLTLSQYNKTRNRLNKEGKLNLRKGRVKKPSVKIKHYSRSQIGYYSIKYRGEYYISVKGEKNAKEIVEKLKQCNWDKSQAQRIKQEVLGC